MKASRSFNRIWKERDSAQPRLLEAMLYKDNFNRAYKRVKANKGAPGIDGMTIDDALLYFKEHQQEFTDRIYRGKYTPSPVRRVEIPKPDGGVRMFRDYFKIKFNITQLFKKSIKIACLDQ